ncbi:hypothetical protein MKZ38_006296 [Zalerion maritima]|uniref:Uncharacterized protein n=1 Tax=Zalerion maritima TaxID=339359 RepID=A0AAD5RJ08_9PEZI|nr:hypothetical protein MKZ38_006296 [Zalerion maritima]
MGVGCWNQRGTYLYYDAAEPGVFGGMVTYDGNITVRWTNAIAGIPVLIKWTADEKPVPDLPLPDGLEEAISPQLHHLISSNSLCNTIEISQPESDSGSDHVSTSDPFTLQPAIVCAIIEAALGSQKQAWGIALGCSMAVMALLLPCTWYLSRFVTVEKIMLAQCFRMHPFTPHWYRGLFVHLACCPRDGICHVGERKPIEETAYALAWSQRRRHLRERRGRLAVP